MILGNFVLLACIFRILDMLKFATFLLLLRQFYRRNQWLLREYDMLLFLKVFIVRRNVWSHFFIPYYSSTIIDWNK